MRKNYKKVLEKSYLHQNIYGFPDKDTIVLPPNPYDYGHVNVTYDKFIFINLNTFEETYVPVVDKYDFWEAPKLIHKFNGGKYLHYQEHNWKIVKITGEEFEIVEELKDEKILGENVYFLDNNEIITFNFGESKIRFLKY